MSFEFDKLCCASKYEERVGLAVSKGNGVLFVDADNG
jgi:hypothetical protein